MQTTKEKQRLGSERGGAAKSAKDLRRFLVLPLVAFLLLTALFVIRNGSPATEDRLEKQRRYEFLKERIEQAHKLSAEETREFCALANELFGAGIASEEDCQALTERVYHESLNAFLSLSEECIQELQKDLGGDVSMTLNNDGHLLRTSLTNEILEIRLVHKSSGHHRYKSEKHCFRIRFQDVHYLNEDGWFGSNRSTHHNFEECPKDRIIQIIKNFKKRWKNKRQR